MLHYRIADALDLVAFVCHNVVYDTQQGITVGPLRLSFQTGLIREGSCSSSLLDSIDTSTRIGLRDRALIAVMVFSLARVSAVVGMNVEDFYLNGRRSWFRFQEKGGKHHEVPAHPKAEAYVGAYLAAAGLSAEKSTPLFRTIARRTGRLTPRRLHRTDALRVVKRRARAAGCVQIHGLIQLQLFGMVMSLAQSLPNEFIERFLIRPLGVALQGALGGDFDFVDFIDQAETLEERTIGQAGGKAAKIFLKIGAQNIAAQGPAGVSLKV